MKSGDDTGTLVIDASPILSVYLNEPTRAWAVEQVAASRRPVMSVINLTEVILGIRRLIPDRAEECEQLLLSRGIEFIPVDVELARAAADARRRFPLNFGDCFCYALAKIENAPILTLDADFRKTDAALLMPPEA